jgi:hypothetical protein
MRDLICKLLLILLLLTSYTYSRQDDSLDEFLHVIGSTAIFLGTYTLLDNHTNWRERNRLITAYFTALTIGVGKEIYDNQTGGYFDYKDLWYNQIGISVCLLITW